MPYLPSIVLLVAGVALLGLLIIRSSGGLRRLARTVTMVKADTGDKVGLLRARAAALRVAIGQRRGRRWAAPGR